MSFEYFALGVLTVVLIASQVFWMKLVINLANRIMSRNYFEVVQAENLKTKRPELNLEPDFKIDPADERQAAELNSLLNIV